MSATSIVLLPGLDGTGVLFSPLLPHLPPSLWPIVVRYPGNEQLGYEALLERVMDALPAVERFIILGESFSGPLAVMASARHPPGLEAIILCSTFVRNPLWIRPPLLRHLARPFLFRWYPLFSMAKALLGGYASSELRASFSEAMATVTPEVLAYRVREVLQVDVSAQLTRCPVPVLCLRGSRDLVVPGHNAAEIARTARHVIMATIAAPHMVLQTRPVEAAAAITRFIESSAKSG